MSPGLLFELLTSKHQLIGGQDKSWNSIYNVQTIQFFLDLQFSNNALRRKRTNINGRAWLNTQAVFLDRKTGAGFLSALAQSFDRPTWGPERNIWRFPEIGVRLGPLNHPFQWDFLYKNNPFGGTYPHFRQPPYLPWSATTLRQLCFDLSFVLMSAAVQPIPFEYPRTQKWELLCLFARVASRFRSVLTKHSLQL